LYQGLISEIDNNAELNLTTAEREEVKFRVIETMDSLDDRKTELRTGNQDLLTTGIQSLQIAMLKHPLVDLSTQKSRDSEFKVLCNLSSSVLGATDKSQFRDVEDCVKGVIARAHQLKMTPDQINDLECVSVGLPYGIERGNSKVIQANINLVRKALGVSEDVATRSNSYQRLCGNVQTKAVEAGVATPMAAAAVSSETTRSSAAAVGGAGGPVTAAQSLHKMPKAALEEAQHLATSASMTHITQTGSPTVATHHRSERSSPEGKGKIGL